MFIIKMDNRIMVKYLLTTLNLIFFSYLGSGQSNEYLRTVNWLKVNGVPVNDPVPPPGFQKFRDCDSNPVYKKLSGDTIIYYTQTSAGSERFEYLDRIKKEPYFNRTVYPQKVLENGTIFIARLVPKTYLYRKDTLFILDKGEAESFDLLKWIEDMENYDKQNIDSVAQNIRGFAEDQGFQKQKTEDLRNFTRADSLWTGSHPPYFKVIFYKNIFKDSNTIVLKRRPVIIKEKEVTPREKIELLNHWDANGKKYYLIKIENALAVSLADKFRELLFTTDGSFPDLENCQVNKKIK